MLHFAILIKKIRICGFYLIFFIVELLPPPSPVVPPVDREADRAPWSRHNRPTTGIYHFRWSVSCRSRSPPTHTHTHTHTHSQKTTTHKNKYTPPAPSGEINFTGSHGELWFPGAPHALCRRRRSFTHPDSWPSIISRVRGAAALRCRRRGEPLLPKTTQILTGDAFFLGAKCQTLKHVSTVGARYRISE